MEPKISVIMGVYNPASKEMIDQCMESILGQSFTDWECVICDDASSNGLFEYLKEKYSCDDRFVFLRNKVNGGLRVALNHCISHAKGKYLVRQDIDDYSKLDRFEKLYQAAQNNPDVDVIGTAMVSFDEKGEHGIIHPRKLKPGKMDFLHGSVVAHATTIMKKESVLMADCYRVSWETTRCEDTDLYMRMYAKGARFENIDEPLYYVRQDRESAVRRKYINRLKEAVVKYKGFRQLKMPVYGYLFVLKPLIVGLVPPGVLLWLKKKYNKN